MSPVLCDSVCVALHSLVNTVLHVVLVKSRTASLLFYSERGHKVDSSQCSSSLQVLFYPGEVAAFCWLCR